MTCFTTRHIQGGGGGVRATFFNSEGAKINVSLGPPGVRPPGYAPASLSMQGRNVVLVFHFGYCLYSTPTSRAKAVLDLPLFVICIIHVRRIKEIVYTKYDLRKFVIVSGVCIKTRTCRSE